MTINNSIKKIRLIVENIDRSITTETEIYIVLIKEKSDEIQKVVTNLNNNQQTVITSLGKIIRLIIFRWIK
jgi:hypothetical protein